MKRMKKKVVAMVTLAMFMMTLLPMAAFAADADNQASKFMTVEENVSVQADTDVEAVFRILDSSNAPADAMANVYVWAEDAAGQVSSAAVFSDYSEDSTNYTVAESVDTNVYTVKDNGNSDKVADGAKINVKFTRPGTYTLHAAKANGIGTGTTAEKLFENQNPMFFTGDTANHNTVVVTAAPAADVKSVVVTQSPSINETLVDNAKAVELAGVYANDAESKEFTLVAYDKDNGSNNGKPIAGKEFTIKSNSANLVLSGDTKTDDYGKLTVKYTAKAAGKYTITAVAGDFNVSFTVVATKDLATPAKITTTLDGKTVELSANPDFKDAVQFSVTDKNGSEVPAQDLNWANEEIWDNNANTNIKDYVNIVEKPDGAKLKDTNIRLISKDDVYTIKFDGVNVDNLKEGKYVVELILHNGDRAEASFNLVKSTDAVSMEIEGNSTVSSTTPFVGKVYTVDKNGIKKQVESADVVVAHSQSAAVNDLTGTDLSQGSHEFTLTVNAGKDYYGTKVTVYAIDKTTGLSASKELTVVDPSAQNVVFEYNKTEGDINKDNTVKVTLKDEAGDIQKDIATSEDVIATVVSKSVEDANVTVTPAQVNKGEFTLGLYADKACTVDVRLAFVDSKVLYADTLTFTFGEQDIPANTSVVMTFGSTEMLVNNKIVDMKDAAPFAQDNRTFVPFRALGEALGAQVEYDKDAKTVTYELGSTKIVMTLDSKTYTVNGAEKTMDVAPFAKDNRTYVPVRFVGEALGFKVTALQNGAGEYVSVAFTK